MIRLYRHVEHRRDICGETDTIKDEKVCFCIFLSVFSLKLKFSWFVAQEIGDSHSNDDDDAKEENNDDDAKQENKDDAKQEIIVYSFIVFVYECVICTF